jgi:methionyl-tRNA synthetase
MPNKMKQLLASLDYQLPSLSLTSSNVLQTLNWTDEIKITRIETLFQKYEKPMEIKNDQIVQPVVAPENFITIDDFAKVELRVGQIISCEIVEKSDKLFKLQVDFGDFGKRQIFTGLRKFLTPDDLIGKQGVFVVNFKPRMIMGMESQGMMLSAEGDGQVVAIHPAKQIALGAKIK